MIHGHGNEIYLYKEKLKIDFSSNIICENISSLLIQHLKNSLNTISNYPEVDARTLQNDIAKHHNLDASNVLVTNGSAEAFYQIAHLFQNKKSLVFTPSFSEYEDACRMYKHQIDFASKLKSLNDIELSYDTVWVGNPNNPDGKIRSIDEISQFCTKNPKTYLILDEAYADLCSDFTSSTPLIQQYQNLIITRSLTKTFVIPGLRLGYILTHSKNKIRLLDYKIPWSVNSLAIEAGTFIMKNYNQILPAINSVLARSNEFQKKLNELEAIEVVFSNCNYFLVKLLQGNAKNLKSYLIEEVGILIRDASNFRTLDASYIRIATQGVKENAILYNEIEKWLNL